MPRSSSLCGVEEVEPAVGCLEAHEEVHLSRDVATVFDTFGQDYFAHQLAEGIRIYFALFYPTAHCVGVLVQSWTLALQRCLG